MYNQIYFLRYKFIFAFLFLFVIYVFFFSNVCFLDNNFIYNYNPKILVNKEIWKHVYGSVGSFASPIIFYNNKYNLNTFVDLINYLTALHGILEEFILNSNTSVFIKSPSDFPEVDLVYQNYMNNMVHLQNQIKNFRAFVQKTDLEVHLFENLVKNTVYKYIKFLESAIIVLELDPNVSDPQVQQLIQHLQSLVNKLNNLIIK